MKFCQSCGMPIDEKTFGTNEDGTANEDYCLYCYKDGKFTVDATLEEFIEMNVKFAKKANMTEDEMRKHCQNILPTLKRWR